MFTSDHQPAEDEDARPVTLDWSNRNLVALPDISQHLDVEVLDLNGNQLTELPAGITQLAALRQLHLAGNQLTELPAEITQLTALQELDLSRNQLTALPTEIGQLAALQHLHLAGNQLTELPAEIGQLTALQRLYLYGNQLTALPAEIGQLTALQQLYLDGNQLAALPAEIGQLTALQRLYLYGNRLTELPAEIGQLTALQRLHLYGNLLTALPAQIGQLITLQQLYLYGNLLTALPAQIGQLIALQQLNLSYNQLTALPAEITQLTALRTLDLSGNQLTALPAEITQLTALQELDLSRNQLTVLPAEIGQLTVLQQLHLTGNQLAVLPAEIGQLTVLQQLNLSYNKLIALSGEIADLIEHGLALSLVGNPLPEPIIDLYEQVGPASLAVYLRSLEETPRFEAKVLLIGEGETGKSSLLAALRKEKFVQGRDSTHGIEIRPLVVPHPGGGPDLTLRAWDFGGQEVYRITHQFFMTRHALYLVVWKPRAGQEQNEVEAWLRRIRLRVGSDARALVIATHCSGGRHADLDYPRLENMFPALFAGHIDVDNQTGYHIPELRAEIAGQVASLPQMGQLLSSRWTAATDQILATPEPQVSFDDFRAACRQHGMEDVEARALAGLLGIQGRVVYYGDDHGLRDFVVLDPEWLTKAISYVLEDGPTIKAGGQLDHARLGEIWQDPSRKVSYPARYHPYLLRLMEKFDISYRLDDDGDQGVGRSLVAQLVPRARPTLPWDAQSPLPTGTRRLALFCELAEPAPGLMEWLTVRNHHSTTDTYWRNGVFLRFPIDEYQSEALLELRTPTELALEVRAPAPDFFFNTLRAGIEMLISKRWPGLGYHLTIPCPVTKPDGTECSKRFALPDLEVHREEGEHVLCTGCRTRHDPAMLLTGFSPPDTMLAEQALELREATTSLESLVRTGFGDLKSELAVHAATTADLIRSLTRTVTAMYRDCPRLFTLSAADRRGVARLKNVLKQRYRLILWCEHPGHWHPWPDATYDAEQTREVVAKITPPLMLVFSLLQAAVPVAAAGAGLVLTAAQLQHAQNELQLATALAAALPAQASQDQPWPAAPGKPDQPTLADSAAWSDVRELIRGLDKGRTPKFGGLTARHDLADDSLYWICPDHVRFYDPGLQRLPAARAAP